MIHCKYHSFRCIIFLWYRHRYLNNVHIVQLNLALSSSFSSELYTDHKITNSSSNWFTIISFIKQLQCNTFLIYGQKGFSFYRVKTALFWNELSSHRFEERISNSMKSVVSPVIKKIVALKLKTLYIKQATCITFYALTKKCFYLTYIMCKYLDIYFKNKLTNMSSFLGTNKTIKFRFERLHSLLNNLGS